MENKKRRITIEIDTEMEALTKERIEYLQSKRPGTKVTLSDAVRQALYQQPYKKSKNNGK